MLIAYVGDDEVIVTTLEQEHTCLETYFGPQNRRVEEYDRKTFPDSMVAISNSLRAE